MSFWNHFDTEGPRTNNNVEGYNNKLKLYVGAAKPNIYKILEIFIYRCHHAGKPTDHSKDGSRPNTQSDC